MKTGLIWKLSERIFLKSEIADDCLPTISLETQSCFVVYIPLTVMPHLRRCA